jgi:hypothetical protein
MKNVTAKKRELAPAIMARVDACAYIFMADRPEKIAAIMEDRGVSELEAGRIYTIGAMKAAKRRGTARNYREALEALEAEQVGDRINPLTRTDSAGNTACTVQCINRINAGNRYIPDYVSGIAAYTTVINNRTVYGPMVRHIAHYPRQEEEKRRHIRNVGKVLGTLYTEWEAREFEADPANEVRHTIIEKNLRVFFAEYTSRLSRTVKTRLADLVNYLDRESNGNALKAEWIIGALTSARGRAAPETSRMATFIRHLHENFAYKDAVTCQEFTGLLCRYGDAG